MTNYAAYMWPVDMITQSWDYGYFQTNVSPALMADAAIPRPQPHELAYASEQSPIAHLERAIIMVTVTRHGTWPVISKSATAFPMPTFGNDILGHWLLVPSTLALGNLLSNQDEAIVIANLFPVQMEIDSVTNATDSGVTVDTGTLPHLVNPYDEYTIDVSVSTIGPPSINGTITIQVSTPSDTDIQNLVVPVTGQRLTLFPFPPEQGYTEELQWKTDILESYSGIEQRIAVRYAARQKITLTPFLTNQQQASQMHMLLFGWLPRVWGVPIWWEQSPGIGVQAAGQEFIAVNTANADYRVGGLVMIMSLDYLTYETFEIASITSNQINLVTGAALINNYLVSKVMPVRTAYAKTTTQARTLITGAERAVVEFTTLDNVYLGSLGAWDIYDGMPILNDPNYVDSELTEGFGRNGVTVIDNTAGTIYQIASTDRSRPIHVKTWWTDNVGTTPGNGLTGATAGQGAAPGASGQNQIWQIRELLHWAYGSQQTLWVPSNRNDMSLFATYIAGGNTMKIFYIGYAAFSLDVNGNPMRPFADIRITLTSGVQIIFPLTGATVSDDGASETLQTATSIYSSNITAAQVARIEFMMLMRVSDDKAVLTHDHPGRAKVVVNLVGVRE